MRRAIELAVEPPASSRRSDAREPGAEVPA
jgi:hypothetical protein